MEREAAALPPPYRNHDAPTGPHKASEAEALAGRSLPRERRRHASSALTSPAASYTDREQATT
eukprot:scaffold133687_cov31-Tisochrysis_lutea.AAC.3